MNVHPSLPERPPIGDPYIQSQPVGNGIIYPQLHFQAQDKQSSFRLSEVRRIRDELEREAEQHTTTRRRYKKAAGVLTGLSVVSNITAVSCSAATVGTIVAPPKAVVLGAVGLTTAAISTICELRSKVLDKRITKHGRIAGAAETRLDTVSAGVSKALVDEQISHDEYTAVLLQLEQYRLQVTKLRTAIKAANGDIKTWSLK